MFVVCLFVCLFVYRRGAGAFSVGLTCTNEKGSIMEVVENGHNGRRENGRRPVEGGGEGEKGRKYSLRETDKRLKRQLSTRTAAVEGKIIRMM